MPDRELYDLAERAGRALEKCGWMVATAESCTGGWVAEAITMIPGSSAWFDRGFVTYTKDAKAELLGIERDLLDQNDAVSEAIARAMAEGALSRSEADIAIAVTGFAGPAGPNCEEGLVHFALARRGQPTQHREEHFGAIGRGAVRVKSLKTLLEMLERALQGE